MFNVLEIFMDLTSSHSEMKAAGVINIVVKGRHFYFSFSCLHVFHSVSVFPAADWLAEQEVGLGRALRRVIGPCRADD